MATNEAFAPAKINLTLHVTGRRADGYHLLDSLVVFADLGDRLWLDPGAQMSLEVSGPFADGVPRDDSNLVWRAAMAAGWRGAIRLEKNLPHGAGIGGGSADAAALLRALHGDDAMRVIGPEATLALGADVPVCLHTGPQRMRGIGEQLTRLGQSVPRLFAVLVNPGVHVPTPQVFKALTCRDNPDMTPMPERPDRQTFLSWLADQRNDLQAAAITQAPVIKEVLAALTATSGCALARMSGSGATCFGLYATRDQAARATRDIAASNAGWWVRSVITCGRDIS